MSEFTVGQKVTIEGYHEGVEAITAITKLGKLKMTLANGQEWKANGHRPWGQNSSWYVGPSVRAYVEGDGAKLARRINYNKVRHFQLWARLSDQQLAVVADFIRGLPREETKS